MTIQLFTDAELEAFNMEFTALDFDAEDTIEETVIIADNVYHISEEEWDSCEAWVEAYNEAKASNNLRVIEHWFYFTESDGSTRVRGITKDATGEDRIVTTSPVKHVLNDVLWTATGSKYQLIHQIQGENVDDICEFWPMFQGC